MIGSSPDAVPIATTVKKVAVSTVIDERSPSNPSVKFTALDAEVNTKTQNNIAKIDISKIACL